MALLERVKVTTPTTGTGILTLGAAVLDPVNGDFLSFVDAGAVDQETYSYVLIDGNAWEFGRGIYLSAADELTRNVIRSSAGTVPIELGGTGIVMCTALSDDIVAPADGKIYIQQDGWWAVMPPDPPAPSAAAGQITVANPPGTNSTSWVMMGLGVAVSPQTTRAIIMCDGQISNSANGGETDAQLVYGSGTPPNNGDPLPGGATLLGGPIRFKSSTSAGGGAFTPFAQSGLITGLVPGQQIWIGLALKVITGNGSVQDLSLLAFELL